MDMKRYYLCLPLLLVLIGCTSNPAASATASTTSEVSSSNSSKETISQDSSVAPTSKFILHHDSKAYIGRMNQESTYSLPTYFKKGEEGVPYVRFEDYVTAFQARENYSRAQEHYDDLECQTVKEGNKYLLKSTNVPKGNKEVSFSFDAEKDEVTIYKGSKYIYRYFYDLDPNEPAGESLCKIVKNKSKSASIWEEKNISLSKYGFDLIDEDGHLYAPIGLFQTIFSENSSPVSQTPIIYNGMDYYFLVDDDTITACNSSELMFIYNDSNAFYPMMNPTVPSIGIPFQCNFKPVQSGLKEQEKYRLETEKIISKEVEGKGKVVPDFKVVISLKKDGKGTFQYVNAETGEPVFNEEYGLMDNRVLTFTEDENMVHIAMHYTSPISGAEQDDVYSIYKGKTFCRASTRDPNYALYDFNVTRLLFGEFYGIQQTAPFMKDVDARIAPYKKDILSTDPLTHCLAMSRFIYEGVDDAHSRVVTFGNFFDCKLEDYDAQIKANSLGRRRNALLNEREYLKSARSLASLKEGYQIIDDTAYLTFDGFLVSPSLDYFNLTEAADEYVTGDTVAFFLTSLSDLAKNHKEEVKRVVIDITANGGGASASLPILSALFSGEAAIHHFNYYWGEKVENHYNLDLNHNGVFGEPEDSYKNMFNYYILTSDMSFSCGNAFPGIVKESGGAKIVGHQSGGGCSVVGNVVSPSGFKYTTSSLITSAYLDKDGNYVENDLGIPVDYKIDPSIWYNRQALNQELAKYENA